jgi:hypothetical protein
MSISEERANPGQPTDGDVGSSSSAASSVGSASSSAGSSSTSSSSSSSSPPGSGASSPRSSTDSRRVAPKWLGKKIGRFRLQALLGQGAVGRVFRAEDTILHRRVALKVITIHSDGGQINRNADQFLTEARAAAALEHPHVVQIYEAGETGTMCYIAMELLDGGNLKDLVVAAGPMDPGRACLLTADAAEALAAGHEAGIIHRDIKPANLMLSRQGRCKVTDFGLATFGDSDTVSTERSAGTPLFAAPEVIRGTSADERSDIYSLGATLFYLLTGRPPYTAARRSEVLRKHLDEPIPDLRQIRPGLPESLVAAVERALDKDPGQRYVTATQFARVLRVQTIPIAPMPTVPANAPAVAGDTVVGASMLHLSGMTAVAGSSSSGQLDAGAAAAAGPLTAADVMTGGAHPVAPVRASAMQSSAQGGPSPAPQRAAANVAVWWRAQSWSAPLRSAQWWATPAGHVGIGVAAVVAMGLTVLLASLALRAHHSDKVLATAPPVASSPAASVVPTAAAPPAAPVVPPVVPVVPTPQLASAVVPPEVAPVVVPAKVSATVVRLTSAEQEPIPVTDVGHLLRIGQGADPTHPNRYATIVGKVSLTRPSANGNTIRIEFGGTHFWIAYWATNKAITTHMAERFGENASSLVGRTIRVTEKITIYDGQPEMVLMATDHVKVDPN